MEQVSVHQCAGVGVEVQGGVKAKLERVDISECAGWGVRAARGSTLQLAASRILRCGGGGVRAEAPAGGAVVVIGCEIASNGGVGVALENCVRKAALKTVGLAAGIAGAMRRDDVLLPASWAKPLAKAPEEEEVPVDRHPCTEEQPCWKCVAKRQCEAEGPSAAELAAIEWLEEAAATSEPPQIETMEDDVAVPGDEEPVRSNLCKERAGSDRFGCSWMQEEEVQLGMLPGSLRVVPFVPEEQPDPTEVERLQNITNEVQTALGVIETFRASGEPAPKKKRGAVPSPWLPILRWI